MGNLLMKDDGVGIHALRELERQWEGDGVEWIDGGTDAWGAMWRARNCRWALVLDAIRSGGQPGSVHCLSLDALEEDAPGVSLHDVSLAGLIRFESAVGNGFESVRVVAMEPADISPGTELSETCRAALPDMVGECRREMLSMTAQQDLQGAWRC
jgi:hydrogenase maturation protease